MNDIIDQPAGLDSDIPVTVYTAASPLRDPARLLSDMVSDLLGSRELAWRLFVRDTSAQYRNSLFGYAWVFIPPLVASLPFVYLNAQGIVKIADTPIPYGAFAMVGTIIWQVFVDAFNSPLRSVSAARGMLARINFPPEAILLAGLLQVGFGFLIRTILLVGVFAWFAIIPPPTALLFPVGVLALILTGFAFGLFLTPLGLLYGDVQQGVPIATSLMLILTPVLYPVPKSGFASYVVALNPLTPLIVATRDWLTIGATNHIFGFAVVTAFAVIVLIVAWTAYRVALPHLIARLGN